jgi:2-amino-4-hydroxy-6-hydroxymethyldihydropteridine diphosphokinase
MAGPVRAFVGVGANLGDAQATVRAALQALGRLPDTQCIASSSLYRSAPVEATGPDFINAVAELRSTLPPLVLLRELQAIEQAFGRVRSVRNAPRTLDLDLLLHGEQRMHGDTLTLPHPRLHLRAFVLRPLAELDPALSLPGLGALGPWLQRASDQAIERLTAAPTIAPP